jgi:hypothetical protein
MDNSGTVPKWPRETGTLVLSEHDFNNQVALSSTGWLQIVVLPQVVHPAFQTFRQMEQFLFQAGSSMMDAKAAWFGS